MSESSVDSSQVFRERKADPGLVWLRVGAVYFVVAVGLGLFMGATGDHSLFPVHAHLNLLGWVSGALVGLTYERWPQLGNTRLAAAQFWMYNLGVPVQMLALVGKFRGVANLDHVLAIAGVVVTVSVILFACNLLFTRLENASASAAALRRHGA
jgi:hypothetical protein